METPEMVPVDSSNIMAVGYDAEGHVLHVRFVSGSHYTYAAVSPEAHAEFMAAPSKGGFFRRAILPHYTATKQPLEKSPPEIISPDAAGAEQG